MIKNDSWLHKRANFLGINTKHINPNSVDLVLGGHIIEWGKFNYIPESMSDTPWIRCEDLNQYRCGHWFKREHDMPEGEEFIFDPERFYLCHSLENIHVPTNKAAMLFLKSSAGRKGLEHSHAGWVDSGFRGQLTWEITSHLPCEWEIGQPMCQLVLIDAEVPNADYSETGRYQDQTGATEAR